MNDSRRDIERDAGELVADYASGGSVCDELYNGILGLLDRQAALTERECIDQRIADQIGSMWKDEKVCQLQAKLDRAEEDAELYRENMLAQTERVAELEGDEPPYDELLRCLENDWHISASWDGLRKFWNVELTEEGVRQRDAELDELKTALTNQKNLEDRLREYDGTHMPLPVDADGVPIRLGDKMRYADGTEFEVDGIGSGGTLFSVDDASDSAWWTNAEGKRHVEPRLLEDVLFEFASRVLNSGHQWGLDAPDVVPEFAAEIRELLRGDGA